MHSSVYFYVIVLCCFFIMVFCLFLIVSINDFNEVTKLTHVVSNQLPYNGVWRSIEFEIQDLCVKENAGIIVYTPLAQGILTGRYNNPDEVPDGISRSRLFSRERSPLSVHYESGCEESLFTTRNKIRALSDR